MAKWIYERWSLKWDDTGFTTGSGSGNYVGKVDIVTMVASEASSVAVGDVALSTQSHISNFNSGENTYLRYVTSVSSGMSGNHEIKSGAGANKEWLANQRIKDARQADVILEEGTVPDDGIHTDGYWYVKVKKAFPTMRILRDGQWVEVETGYVLKDGVWKQIEEIYKLQDGKWVQA